MLSCRVSDTPYSPEPGSRGEGGKKHDGEKLPHCSIDSEIQRRKAPILALKANSSGLKRKSVGQEGVGGSPSTFKRNSGNPPNLQRGLVENETEATGARAKNILTFLASSGIRENAIKPVGTKGRQEFHLVGLFSGKAKVGVHDAL